MDEGVVEDVDVTEGVENVLDAATVTPSRLRLHRRVLRVVVTIGLIIFAVVSVGAWFIGSRLTAPVRGKVWAPNIDAIGEGHTIESRSGATLAAWSIERKDAVATVILLHPIRSNRRAMLRRAQLCLDAGFSVMLVDLQAHGESTGDRITFGFRESDDVASVIAFTKSRDPTQRIGIVGWSLGGASALLASPAEVDAIVLESVFPSIEEAIRNRIARRLPGAQGILAPFLLLQFPARLGFWPSQLRPIDFVERVGCPLLFATGDADQHTPFEETERMYARARQPKRLIVFPDATHEDLFAYDPERYQREVIGFLEQQLLHHHAKPNSNATQSATQSVQDRR